MQSRLPKHRSGALAEAFGRPKPLAGVITIERSGDLCSNHKWKDGMTEYE